jgi:hypothetical protein
LKDLFTAKAQWTQRAEEGSTDYTDLKDTEIEREFGGLSGFFGFFLKIHSDPLNPLHPRSISGNPLNLCNLWINTSRFAVNC